MSRKLENQIVVPKEEALRIVRNAFEKQHGRRWTLGRRGQKIIDGYAYLLNLDGASTASITKDAAHFAKHVAFLDRSKIVLTAFRRRLGPWFGEQRTHGVAVTRFATTLLNKDRKVVRAAAEALAESVGPLFSPHTPARLQTPRKQAEWNPSRRRSRKGVRS